MKYLVLLTILAVCQSRLLFGSHLSMPVHDEVLSEGDLLVQGFFSGMALDSDISKLLPCLVDLESVLKDLGKSMEGFKSFTILGLRSAFKNMEKTLKLFPSAINECAKDMKSDYLRLMDSLRVIGSPDSIEYVAGEKLEINGVNILDDISRIVQDFTHKKWREVGFSFGSILAKVCGTGKNIN